MYAFSLEIDLEPVHGLTDPVIRYGISGIDSTEVILDTSETIVYKNLLSAGSYTFEIELINKHKNDSTLAVEIKNIRVMEFFRRKNKKNFKKILFFPRKNFVTLVLFEI